MKKVALFLFLWLVVFSVAGVVGQNVVCGNTDYDTVKNFVTYDESKEYIVYNDCLNSLQVDVYNIDSSLFYDRPKSIEFNDPISRQLRMDDATSKKVCELLGYPNRVDYDCIWPSDGGRCTYKSESDYYTYGWNPVSGMFEESNPHMAVSGGIPAEEQYRWLIDLVCSRPVCGLVVDDTLLTVNQPYGLAVDPTQVSEMRSRSMKCQSENEVFLGMRFRCGEDNLISYENTWAVCGDETTDRTSNSQRFVCPKGYYLESYGIKLVDSGSGPEGVGELGPFTCRKFDLPNTDSFEETKSFTNTFSCGASNIDPTVYTHTAPLGTAFRKLNIVSRKDSDAITSIDSFNVEYISFSCKEPACSDGLDNDGDGSCDFSSSATCTDGSTPEDLDCSTDTDINEFGNKQCSDGIDNDGDGLIDSSDNACLTGSPPTYDPLWDDERSGGSTPPPVVEPPAGGSDPYWSSFDDDPLEENDEVYLNSYVRIVSEEPAEKYIVFVDVDPSGNNPNGDGVYDPAFDTEIVDTVTIEDGLSRPNGNYYWQANFPDKSNLRFVRDDGSNTFPSPSLNTISISSSIYDDPLEVEILDPICGDYIIIGGNYRNVQDNGPDGWKGNLYGNDPFVVRIRLNDHDDYVTGTVYNGDEAIDSFDNLQGFEVEVDVLFTQGGNVPLRVEAINTNGEEYTKTVNIMVVDSDSDTVDYAVASCIDEPENNERFDSTQVYFNGENSRGLMFDGKFGSDTEQKEITIIPSDELYFLWKFYHNGVYLNNGDCEGLGSRACNDLEETVSIPIKMGVPPRHSNTVPVNKVTSFVRTFATVDKNSVQLTVSLDEDNLPLPSSSSII